MQDIRYGLRMLLKHPGFTFVAVLTLMLGIGINVAIFSVVNAVILRPLPFQRPDRLVNINGANVQSGSKTDAVSPDDFSDFRKRSQSFEEMAAVSYWTFNITGRNEPERILGARTSGSFFSLLGVQPIVGRVYSMEDDRPDAPEVAVISYGLWKRRFGSDPGLIGQQLTLNGITTTVIGVLPSGFHYPDDTMEVWAPLAGELQGTPRNARFLSPVVARLKDGVTLEQAQAELETISRKLEEEYPDSNKGRGVQLVSLHESIVGVVRPALMLLLGAVGFVLLIACANVANLMLARATTRQKEMAIRTALGASRLRIVRQLLIESMLLSLVGGVLALFMALWGVDLLVRFSPGDIPRLNEIIIDGRVLGFTLALSLLTGLIFGLAPALSASRVELNEALKESSRSASVGSRRHRMRNALVVSEIALALVLLISGGLLIRSFVRLLNVELGFSPARVLTMQVFLTGSKFQKIPQQKAFVQEALERIKTLPGVEDAASATSLPLSGPSTGLYISIEGQSSAPGEQPSVNYRAISPDYFRTLNIPLLKGRAFDQQDREDASPVFIVNETFARRYFPNEDPLGKRVRWVNQGSELGWHTIVGVVGDVKSFGLDRAEKPAIYGSYLQRSFPWMRGTSLLVRTAASDPMSLAGAVRNQLLSLDPDQPVYDIKTMEQLLGNSVAKRRFSMLLLGTLSAVAMMLAAIGIYGLISYSVTQRTHEIGIRMALGAGRRDILRMIVGQGLILTLTGVALGLLAAFTLTRLMASLLFGVTATDPLTFACVALLLTVVALLASYIPARRATRVDPMVALRYE